MKLKEIKSKFIVPDGFVLVVSKNYIDKTVADYDIKAENFPPFYLTKREDFNSDAFDNLIELFPVNIERSNFIQLLNGNEMRIDLNRYWTAELCIKSNKSALIEVK